MMRCPARPISAGTALVLLTLALGAAPVLSGDRTSHEGLLGFTADRLSEPTLTGHLLSFPPALVIGGAGPIAGPISVLGYAGGVGPVFREWIFAGSGAVRAQLVTPSESRWGLAAQTQGFLLTDSRNLKLDRRFGGLWFAATGLFVSSPIRPLRFHGGVDLHTLAMDTGSQDEDRDVVLVPGLSLAGERRWPRTSLYAELDVGAFGKSHWGGAAGGLLLVGLRFWFDRTDLKLTSGAGFGFVAGGGGAGALAVPVPPIASYSLRL